MSKTDNKELEEAINYFKKRMDICLENAEICDKNDFDEEATCLRKEQILIETVLKELKRLQEENKKMEIEIANHVYWESTPVNEIKKMYVPKDKIREKIKEQKELKEKYLKMREYGQVDIRLYKIAILKKLLEGK